MADETQGEAPAEPVLTPEEQAASDAHSAVNEAEQGWSGKVEQRLAAIEAHLGLGEHAADDTAETADDTAETADDTKETSA